MIETTPRPSPIRVRIDQRFPTDEERAAAVDEDPAESIYDTIPDDQRAHVLLQWIHAALQAGLAEAEATRAALERLEDRSVGIERQVEGARLAVETIDKRIAAGQRSQEEARTAALDAQIARPKWLRLLEHPTARPALGLLTWLGGMGSMAVLDYLGLESEPIFRLFAAIWGL